MDQLCKAQGKTKDGKNVPVDMVLEEISVR
jgi:hypothetical protein